MSSLYKRANARQRRILTIVEGAVKNAADHHSGFTCYSPRLARSIAKRAAGTLTAEWPDVLATPKPVSSDKLRHGSGNRAGPPVLESVTAPESEQDVILGPSAPRGTVRPRYGRTPTFPTQKLIKELSYKTGRLRKGDFIERIKAEGMIEALRIIDRLQK